MLGQSRKWQCEDGWGKALEAWQYRAVVRVQGPGTHRAQATGLVSARGALACCAALLGVFQVEKGSMWMECVVPKKVLATLQKFLKVIQNSCMTRPLVSGSTGLGPPILT